MPSFKEFQILLGLLLLCGASVSATVREKNVKVNAYCNPSFLPTTDTAAGSSAKAPPASSPLSSVQLHRINYLNLSRETPTNQTPSSSEFAHDDLPSQDYQQRELRYQISAKMEVTDPVPSSMLGLLGAGWQKSGWLAYTQKSFWQTFDKAKSRPFRENNYEPEGFISWKLSDTQKGGWCELNIGAVHQSNGRTDPMSRTWNRVYLQSAWRSETQRYGTAIKVHNIVGADDNPAIGRYLGYWEAEAFWVAKDWGVNATIRKRSAAVDLTFRTELIGIQASDNLRLHVRYFTGYGENMLDYNHRHSSLGIGISAAF